MAGMANEAPGAGDNSARDDAPRTVSRKMNAVHLLRSPASRTSFDNVSICERRILSYSSGVVGAETKTWLSVRCLFSGGTGRTGSEQRKVLISQDIGPLNEQFSALEPRFCR